MHACACVLLALAATAHAQGTAAQPRFEATGGYVGNDADGNMLVNSSAGAKVFIDGVDILGEIAWLRRMVTVLSATAEPTANPTNTPTAPPTAAPTTTPTVPPTAAPTSSTPTASPTYQLQITNHIGSSRYTRFSALQSLSAARSVVECYQATISPSADAFFIIKSYVPETSP